MVDLLGASAASNTSPIHSPPDRSLPRSLGYICWIFGFFRGCGLTLEITRQLEEGIIAIIIVIDSFDSFAEIG